MEIVGVSSDMNFRSRGECIGAVIPYVGILVVRKNRRETGICAGSRLNEAGTDRQSTRPVAGAEGTRLAQNRAESLVSDWGS